MTWYFDPTVAASQGVAALSITAVSGSYSISGAAASLERRYEITAVAGSYSLSGSTVTLSYSLEVLALAGSYSLSGSAASLRATLLMSAAAGAYTIAGLAASLEMGREVVALPGSYSITGISASLERGYEIVAAAGSYSLSGTDASLLLSAAVTLIAEPGSYSWSGTSADLVYVPAVTTPGGGGVPAEEHDRFHDYRSARRAKTRKLEETIVEAYAKLPETTQAEALDIVIEAEGDPKKLDAVIEALASQLASKDSIGAKLKFQKAERLRKQNAAIVADMRRQAEELRVQRIVEFEEQRAHQTLMLEEEAIAMLLLM